MKYKINEDTVIEIIDKTGEVIIDVNNKKDRYNFFEIKKILRHSSPNQLYFNGIDLTLLRYITYQLLPYHYYNLHNNRTNNINKGDTFFKDYQQNKYNEIQNIIKKILKGDNVD